LLRQCRYNLITLIRMSQKSGGFLIPQKKGGVAGDINGHDVLPQSVSIPTL
jgi:hypothetical protein